MTAIQKNILIFVILLCVTIISLTLFQNFQPKALKQIEEIKESTSSFQLTIPFPANSEKIGSSENENSSQITFRTTKTSQEVQTFYRTYFVENGWEAQGSEEKNGFITSRYELDEETAIVITSEDIVSVEIELDD